MAVIGVISEGHADRAVIENIVKGLIEKDYEFFSILPKYSKDETDKAADQHGGNSAVFNCCRNGQLVKDFFSFDGNENIIIQLDSAESRFYGIQVPQKNSETYIKEIIDNLNSKINSFIAKYTYEDGEDVVDQDKVLLALAVEEIEAWILTIYLNRDTSSSADVKRTFDRELGRQGITTTSDYKNFKEISKDFAKNKNWRKFRYHMRNNSLEIFKSLVETKLKME